MPPKTIEEFQGEYRFLSNFYPCDVYFNGQVWPSAEHAYQAAKSLDWRDQEAIRHVPKARDAKRMGRYVQIRPDWEQVKLSIMEEIVLAKFSQNQRLRNLLILTGDAQLVEGNWWNDTFWGVCRGRGTNHLGRILMKVRGMVNQNPEPRRQYGSRHVADSGPDYRE